MAWSTPTTRTPLTHRMDHNQPQQQPHRNPSPHRTHEDGRTRHQAGADHAPQHNQGQQHPPVRPRTTAPGSKHKGPKAQQQCRGRQDSVSSQQTATPPHQARGQPRPTTATTLQHYSSSEMYPLATRRWYSLAINNSSGDSTMQLTRASLPPTLTPTPCGVTKVER